MSLSNHLEDACDSIDAGVFSGDSLYDPDAIERIEWYMGRWQRELESIKQILKEEEE